MPSAWTTRRQALARRLLPLLFAGAYDPPWVRELARGQQIPEDQVRKVPRKLLRRGDVAQVVPDLFYHRARVEALAALIRKLAGASAAAGGATDAAAPAPGIGSGVHSGVDAAGFRDATGLGRKRAIQILEFFDRVGYTCRVRGLHVIRTDAGASLFEAGTAAAHPPLP